MAKKRAGEFVTHIESHCTNLIDKLGQSLSNTNRKLKSANHLVALARLTVKSQTQRILNSGSSREEKLKSLVDFDVTHRIFMQGARDWQEAKVEKSKVEPLLDRIEDALAAKEVYRNERNSGVGRAAGCEARIIRAAIEAAILDGASPEDEGFRDLVWEHLPEDEMLTISNEKISREIRTFRRKVPSVE